MKPPGISFSEKGLSNLLISFQGMRIDKNIKDEPRKVTQYHYCMSQPKSRINPHIAGLSKRVIEMLGYDEDSVLADEHSSHYFSGSKLIPGSTPLAHNYCGHQFGVWAGQLGDGRAHTIGHVQNNKKVYELQLKGSGLSPFSRHADGNSVVSSAVREFLASELMAGLGIPTTRALSLVIADDQVVRDPFYNGNRKIQKAAIVIRVAQSFLRFGSFQVCNKKAQLDKGDPIQNRQIIKTLADYLITNFYKDIDEEEGDIYEQLFSKIVTSTAELVAHWQSVGFVHGVLNTDNMSMVNVTIDYGPFGFIDYFSKDFVSNATDEHERYSYRQQPSVIRWNLVKLAQAFDVLVPSKLLKKIIDEKFQKTFEEKYDRIMADKLGLPVNQKTKQIVKQLLQIMHVCGSNFTNVFRKLSEQTEPQKLIQDLLVQSFPTQYFLRSLRVIENVLPEQYISQILAQDDGFNKYFLTQQHQRRKMVQNLKTESCEQRTTKQRELWKNWYVKYSSMNPNKEKQRQNTVQYVLLNEVAKNITQQLNSTQKQGQRQFLNKILDVFASPYTKNQWFQTKFWSKRPVPVRLTCSS